jgi:hypothetical protein
VPPKRAPSEGPRSTAAVKNSSLPCLVGIEMGKCYEWTRAVGDQSAPTLRGTSKLGRTIKWYKQRAQPTFMLKIDARLSGTLGKEEYPRFPTYLPHNVRLQDLTPFPQAGVIAFLCRHADATLTDPAALGSGDPRPGLQMLGDQATRTPW